MVIGGLLPIGALILFVVHLRRSGFHWRVAGVVAAVGWCTLIAVSTEVLGAFSALTAPVLALLWALVGLATGVAIARQEEPVARRRAASDRGDRVTTGERAVLAGLGVIGVATAAAGALSAPNNYDSMSYHLTRVSRWLGEQSVAHFATHNRREITQPPLSEYVFLQLTSLTSGDALDFLASLLAWIGCAVAASWITRQLGGKAVAQVAAAAFVMTTPMAIAQASSTQSNLLLAFFIMATWATGLALARPDADLGRRVAPWALIGFGALTMGLALMTKGTVVVIGTPVYVWFAVVVVRRWADSVRVFVGFAVVAVLILNGPFLARNFSTYGRIDDGQVQGMTFNESVGLTGTSSNLLRHLALEGATPFAAVNDWALLGPVVALHDGLGMDVSDGRFTFFNFGGGGAPSNEEGAASLTLPSGAGSRSEDTAASPLHLLLLLAAAAAVPFLGPEWRRRLAAPAILPLAGFVLFSIWLRWQPWNNRLLLPVLLLGGPVVAMVASRIAPRKVVLVGCAVLVLLAVPVAFTVPERPLVGTDNPLNRDRDSSYFASRPELEAPIREAVRVASTDCDRIGVIGPFDFMAYPIWALTDATVPGSTDIRHIGVHDASQQYEDVAFEPCAVTWFRDDPSAGFSYNGVRFHLVWTDDDGAIAVYRSV